MASETAMTIIYNEEKDLPDRFQRASKLVHCSLGTSAKGLDCPLALQRHNALKKLNLSSSQTPSANSGWRFFCSFQPQH